MKTTIQNRRCEGRGAPARGGTTFRRGGLRIGVDFDGVLFDHIPYVLRAFRDTHGIDLSREEFLHWDVTRHEAVRERGLTWQCVRSVLQAIETDPLVHEAPLRDRYSGDVIRRWRSDGHTVQVVTARDPESRVVTQAFLEGNGIEHDGLRMGVDLKTGYDVLVDDAPHNVTAAAAQGGMALVMDQPYNRYVEEREGLVRVRNWFDVEQEVLAALLPALHASAVR